MAIEGLTKQEEVFVNGLAQGLSQRQAYLKAYPKRRKWKENSLDNHACLIRKKPKVSQRYAELMETLRAEEQAKTKWTREQSIETLRFVVDKNKEDLERINRAAEEEVEMLLQLMQDHPEKAPEFAKQLLKQKKQRRISGIHNGGIIGAVAELNKMQGFNEETINLNGAVVFSGEDELED